MRNAVLLALYGIVSLQSDIVAAHKAKGAESPPFCIQHEASGMYAQAVKDGEAGTPVIKLVANQEQSHKWILKAAFPGSVSSGYLETDDGRRLKVNVQEGADNGILSYEKPKRKRGKVPNDNYEISDLVTIHLTPPRIMTPTGPAWHVFVKKEMHFDEMKEHTYLDIGVDTDVPVTYTPVGYIFVQKDEMGIASLDENEYQDFLVVDCETEDHLDYFDADGHYKNYQKQLAQAEEDEQDRRAQQRWYNQRKDEDYQRDRYNRRRKQLDYLDQLEREGKEATAELYRNQKIAEDQFVSEQQDDIKRITQKLEINKDAVEKDIASQEESQSSGEEEIQTEL